MNYYGIKFYVHPVKNDNGTVLVYLYYRKKGLNVKYYLKTKTYQEFLDFLEEGIEPPKEIQEEVSKRYKVFPFEVEHSAKTVFKDMTLIAELVKKYEVEHSKNPTMWTNDKLKTYINSNYLNGGK